MGRRPRRAAMRMRWEPRAALRCGGWACNRAALETRASLRRGHSFVRSARASWHRIVAWTRPPWSLCRCAAWSRSAWHLPTRTLRNTLRGSRFQVDASHAIRVRRDLRRRARWMRVWRRTRSYLIALRLALSSRVRRQVPLVCGRRRLHQKHTWRLVSNVHERALRRRFWTCSALPSRPRVALENKQGGLQPNDPNEPGIHPREPRIHQGDRPALRDAAAVDVRLNRTESDLGRHRGGELRVGSGRPNAWRPHEYRSR